MDECSFKITRNRNYFLNTFVSEQKHQKQRPLKYDFLINVISLFFLWFVLIIYINKINGGGGVSNCKTLDSTRPARKK